MLKNFDHIQIASYLAYFLVPAIVTGPFLSDLTLSLLAIYFVVILFIFKPIQIIPKEFTILFFLSFFYMIIRSSFSKFAVDSITYDGVIFYFRYYFFCLAILYLSIYKKKFLENFFLISIITTLVVISDGTLQLITGKNILGWEIDYRVSGLFKDELVIGIFLSKIIILCFTYYDLTNTNKYKISRYLYLLIGFIFLVYTRERAALALFVLYFFIYLFFIKKFNFKKYFIFICFFTVLTILILFSSKQIFHYLFITISQIKAGYIPILPYPEGYEGLIISSLNIFNENNIFFGSGANSFRNLCLDYAFKNFCTSHPHNYYIQILIDFGLIGIIFIIALYIRVVKYLFHIGSENRIFQSFILIVLVNFFPLIPSMNFFNNWTNVMIFLPISISLCFWYKIKKL